MHSSQKRQTTDSNGERPGFTGRITLLAARHPWRTLGVWLLLVAAAFGASGAMNLTHSTAPADTEATTASNLIKERLREQTPPEEFIVVESTDTTADDTVFAGFVDSLAGDLRALPQVASVVSYRDGAEGLVSQDGHTALVTARLVGDEKDAAETAKPLVDVVQRADGADGFRVTTVGFGSVEGQITTLLQDTLKQGEMIGIGVALVILLIVFGAAVAAGLPIIVALLAIFVAVGATALVSNAMEMSDFVVFIVTMIGLAVGIDYSLFIVQRFREERSNGRPTVEAITRAGSTASRAVLFSGMAVTIALAGMLIAPDAVFRSFAVGAMIVVAVTVLAALTLLPAVLALLGDRVSWLTLPFIGKRGPSQGTGGIWGLITRVVTARPAVSVLLSGGLLVAAALPVFNINLGSVGIGTLPDNSNPRHAFDVLNREFSDGVLTADVVIEAPDVNAPAVQKGIDGLTAALDGDKFFGTSKIEKNKNGNLAVLTVAMPGDFSSSESKSALQRLRGNYIPAAFPDHAADVFVGGPTAETVDSVQTQKDYLPFVFTFVLGLSFLLLLVVFRSIVVPLKAVLMNLLSVGAAYGLLVLVFQEGIGAGLLGFQRAPVIESWLPLFLFAILFGLSMDYHVFLLSRIKEHYDETGDNRASVAHGLRQTASIITGAALIMVAVFAGMASGDLVTFQQVGFGLAVAIIVDATIVRMVLVPASMELLGDWNWYFPRWLAWVPEIHIEGRGVQAPEPAPFPGTEDMAREPAFVAEVTGAIASAPPISTGAAKPGSVIGRALRAFFGVAARGQSYRNMLYMALSFPLGVAYFTFLVTGISVGASLTIIWVGIPILLLTLAGWWLMAALERQLIIRLLRIEVPPMSRGSASGSAWARLKAHLRNPVTWKSLVYLFAEFPFGVAAISVLATAGSMAFFVTAPAFYPWVGFNVVTWKIDTLDEALIWPVPGLMGALVLMHLMNGMAYVWARFARLMLGAPTVERERLPAAQRDPSMLGVQAGAD